MNFLGFKKIEYFAGIIFAILGKNRKKREN